MEQVLLENLVCKFSAFMEPDGSSPSSQEPASFSYTEPDQSSPRILNGFFKDVF
jgi:hypothetical protein